MLFAVPRRIADSGSTDLVLLHLGSRGARKVLHDVDEARDHEIGHVAGAVLQQLLRLDSKSFAKADQQPDLVLADF